MNNWNIFFLWSRLGIFELNTVIQYCDLISPPNDGKSSVKWLPSGSMLLFEIISDGIKWKKKLLTYLRLLHRYAVLHKDTGEPLCESTLLRGRGVGRRRPVMMHLMLRRTLRTDWINWIYCFEGLCVQTKLTRSSRDTDMGGGERCNCPPPTPLGAIFALKYLKKLSEYRQKWAKTVNSPPLRVEVKMRSPPSPYRGSYLRAWDQQKESLMEGICSPKISFSTR